MTSVFNACHAHAERMRDILGHCSHGDGQYRLRALQEVLELFFVEFSRLEERDHILYDFNRNEIILPTEEFPMHADCGYSSQQGQKTISRHLEVLMAAGDCLAAQGLTEEARTVWCRLQRAIPNHAGLHQRLSSPARRHGSKEPCGCTYRLESAASFTHESLNRPFLMCVNNHKLYVSNGMAPVITVFDVQGKYLGDMGGDFISTRGIFPDASGNIWTCDFNTAELICFGPGGSIIERIDFNLLLAGHTNSRRPIYGDFDGHHAFIQASDDSNRNGVLVRLDLDRPSETMSIRSVDGLNTPGGIHCRGNSVYFANQRSPALYKTNKDMSEYVKIYSQLKGWVINFDFAWDTFYISIPGELTKVDANGKHLQTSFYCNILKTFNHYIDGITAYDSGTEKFLFLADANNNYIHKIFI